MKVRAAVCSGLNEPWKTEEVDVEPPGPHEVLVQMAYAGMCHSDEHLRTGDMGVPPEVLPVFDVDSMYPMIGGHEGAGIVVEIGSAVESLAVGRSRGRFFHPGLRQVPLVRHRSSVSLRPRHVHPGRPDDGRRGLALPPRRQEGEPDDPARHLLGPGAGQRAVTGQDRPGRVSEGGRPHQLRDRHRLRLGRRPGQGQARRDGGRDRLRRCRLGRHPGCPHRRGPHDHRRRPHPLQGREGQGDRGDPRGGFHPGGPPHDPRHDRGADGRRGHPHAREF